MHPDDEIAALRREAERFPEHADAVAAEIARLEKLPRPEVRPEDPDTVVDASIEYLRALGREKSRSASDRHAEIDAEIARVKAELRSGRTSRATDDAGVENTTNAPARRGRPPKNEE